MSKTLKNSILSALVLIAFVTVSVVVLVVINSLLPAYEAKLDIDTVSRLNKVVNTGVDDQTALDQSYFAIDDKLDLEAFNSEYGSTTDRILAVYIVKEGAKADTVIVETQVKAYNAGVVVFVAFKDGKFESAGVKSSHENPTNENANIFNSENFPKIAAMIAGKTAVTNADIQVATGSTASSSISGLVKLFNLSSSAYNELVKLGGAK